MDGIHSLKTKKDLGKKVGLRMKEDGREREREKIGAKRY